MAAKQQFASDTRFPRPGILERTQLVGPQRRGVDALADAGGDGSCWLGVGLDNQMAGLPTLN
jgi:hypothetical protein